MQNHIDVNTFDKTLVQALMKCLERMMKKLSSDESIIGLNGLNVGDFWSWAYSDILSNRNRSVFAEFIVGSALEIVNTPRIEWDAVDLLYRGKKIEVKSSGYIQSWHQTNYSLIRFDIAKKKSWHADTGTVEDKATRSADCYVFCIFSETDPIKANVLNLENWQFYVVSTAQIEREVGDQKTVGIKRLQAMCDSVSYNDLRDRVDLVLEGSNL